MFREGAWQPTFLLLSQISPRYKQTQGHKQLEPSDEQRVWKFVLGGAQNELIEENHCERYHEVEGNDYRHKRWWVLLL